MRIVLTALIVAIISILTVVYADAVEPELPDMAVISTRVDNFTKGIEGYKQYIGQDSWQRTKKLDALAEMFALHPNKNTSVANVLEKLGMPVDNFLKLTFMNALTPDLFMSASKNKMFRMVINFDISCDYGVAETPLTTVLLTVCYANRIPI